MRTFAWVSVLFALGISACTPQAADPPRIVEEHLEMAAGNWLQVDLNNCELWIQNGAGDQIKVSAHLSYPAQTQFQLTPALDGAALICSWEGGRQDAPGAVLDLLIPEGVSVAIDGFSGNVRISRMFGEVKVFNTTGAIIIEDSGGIFSLNSNRGDITVRQSKGEFIISGNYGLLTVEDSHGKIGMSTIMGAVRFLGTTSSGDEIRLETDHGPVEVQLGIDSSLTGTVETTSGKVACTISGFYPLGRGCMGVLGDGSASLWVRTVSGAVSLQRLQPQP